MALKLFSYRALMTNATDYSAFTPTVNGATGPPMKDIVVGSEPTVGQSIHTIALTADQFYLIQELLSNQICLHAQNGKKQITHRDTRIHASQMVQAGNPDQYSLSCPFRFDSVAIQCDSLPSDLLICDIDDQGFAHVFRDYFLPPSGGNPCIPLTIVECTPGGGLHVWGRVRDRPSTGPAMSQCGIPYEVFTSTRRITIVGPGRDLLTRVPFAQIPQLPQVLEPASMRLSKSCRLEYPIEKGSRYQTILHLVNANPLLTPDGISFIAERVCTPPWEQTDVGSMIAYWEKRRGATDREGEEMTSPAGISLEARAIKALIPMMKDSWMFRLPVGRWYRYSTDDRCWKRSSTTNYELDVFLQTQIEAFWGASDFELQERARLSTKRFRETLMLGLETSCYCEPPRRTGLAFRNGRPRMTREGGISIEVSQASDYVFAGSSLSIDFRSPLASVFRHFLLDLTDGNLLKINVLRAFIGLIALGNYSHQVALYLVGPGGSGKSTLTNLLLKIAGEAGTSMTLNRLSNRFELIKLLDKTLVVLPDIPSGRVGNVICSIIKRAIGGEIVQGEIKNGDLVDIDPIGLWLITSNRIWKPDDLSGGFDRRILYLETPRAAPEYDLTLATRLEAEAESLISWALAMPWELMDLSNRANLLNPRLGGSGYDADAMVAWITTCLFAAERQSERLGAKHPAPPGSLFESYTVFAEARGAEPIEFYQFGGALIDRLQTWGYSDSVMKRRRSGYRVLGVTLDPQLGARIQQSGTETGLGGLDQALPWGSFETDYEEYRVREKVRKAKLYGPPAIVHPLEDEDEEAVVGENGAIVPAADAVVGENGAIVPAADAPGYKEVAQRALQRSGAPPRADLAELSAALESWCTQGGGRLERFMPSKLMRSTILEGVPYPLASEVKRGLKRLRESPELLQPVVDLLNKHSVRISESAFQSCKEAFPQDQYYKRKNPVRTLWPGGYNIAPTYPRLKPSNHRYGDTDATIMNLKRYCRQVVLEIYHQAFLPDGWVLIEIDMAACHTGIFLGLMGVARAPHTWECYDTGDFWKAVKERYGDDLPKAALKVLLYSGLNGANVENAKSIEEKLKDKLSPQDLNGPLPTVIEAAQRHPILQELISFQRELSRHPDGLHLPTVIKPYRGKTEEVEKGTKCSRYQPGLQTSRALTSHEVILLGCLVEVLLLKRRALPVSLEHDGFRLLCRADEVQAVKDEVQAALEMRSLELCGIHMYSIMKDG